MSMMLHVENAEFIRVKALLLLQLLIALINISTMNVCAISNGFLIVSLKLIGSHFFVMKIFIKIKISTKKVQCWNYRHD